MIKSMDKQRLTSNRERIMWIDIAKGISIFLMIIGHVKLFSWDLRVIIFSFHMPLFFILSGYTYKEPERLTQYAKKLAKQLLLPYFCTAFFMGVIYCFQYPIDKWCYNWIWTIKAAAYGTGVPVEAKVDIPVIGALWFLPCLFLSKLFYAFIRKKFRFRSEWFVHLLIVILSAAGVIIGRKIYLPWSLDIALVVLFFLHVGYMGAQLQKQQAKWQWSVIAFVVWVAGICLDGLELASRYYPYYPVCMIAACAGTFVICIFGSYLSKNKNFIVEILLFSGKNSLYLLCAHQLEGIIFPWTKIAEKIPIESNLIRGGIVAMGRCVIALLLAVLFVKMKEKNSGDGSGAPHNT